MNSDATQRDQPIRREVLASVHWIEWGQFKVNANVVPYSAILPRHTRLPLLSLDLSKPPSSALLHLCRSTAEY